MIEERECDITCNQVINGVDETTTIERNIAGIKRMISSQEESLHHFRVLFHAMDLTLRERLELSKAKELALLERTPKSLIVLGTLAKGGDRK